MYRLRPGYPKLPKKISDEVYQELRFSTKTKYQKVDEEMYDNNISRLRSWTTWAVRLGVVLVAITSKDLSPCMSAVLLLVLLWTIDLKQK